jgi:hypothetical protein
MAGSAEGGAGVPSSSERRVTRWILVVTAASVLVGVGSPLLGISVFHGADMLLDRAPWRVTPPEVNLASNPIVGDTVSTFMPLHAELRRRLWGGDFPVWTPLPAGGLPLASVPDAGALGPLNLPYLVVPLAYAPGLSKLLEMAAAIGFTFLFLRRLGLGRAPSLLGGLVYAFSGFQVVWTNWPQSHVGALTPALFWSVERTIQERRLVSGIPVAVAVAAMVFEGFPSLTGYAVLAVSAYAIVRTAAFPALSPRSRLWALGVVGAGLALGFGLTALQTLPLADRAGELDLAYRMQGPDSHLPPSTMATLAIPDAFGSPATDDYAGPLNYVEVQAFIGASSMVALAAAAAWRLPGSLARGARSFLWAAVAFVFVVLYVGGPTLGALQTSSLFGLNFVGRLRSVLGFFLASLAAVGLEVALRAPPSEDRRAALRATGAWTAAGLLGGLGLWRLWSVAEATGRLPDVVRASLIPLAAAGVAAAAFWAARSARWRHRLSAVWVLPVVFAAEALTFAVPFWPRIPHDSFYPTTPAHRQLAQRLGSDRMVGAGGAMFPGTTTLYGLRSLTTNNTLPQLPPWEDLIRAVDPAAFDQSPVFPSLAPTHEVATSPVLDRLSVRFVMAPPNLPVFGRRVSIATPTSDTLMLGPGESTARPLPGEGPWRAVLVPLAKPLEVPDGSAMAAEIRDAEGETLSSGRQLVFDGQGPGTIQILLPEASCTEACTPPFTVEITLHARTGVAVVPEGVDGGPALSIVEAADDGLRLEITATVAGYRRLNALPRIRWADTTAVMTSAGERVALLSSGLPADVVLLGRAGPEAQGQPAEIEVIRDSGDQIRASVSARGDGYLVVADPLQHGWEATLDGRPALLRAADHALVALFVPAGEHEVVFRFGLHAWRTGVWISVASAAILGLVGLAAVRRRRTSAGRFARPSDPRA